MKFSWDPVNVARLLYVFRRNWNHWILRWGPGGAAGRGRRGGGVSWRDPAATQRGVATQRA